jgi:hypothetical protein
MCLISAVINLVLLLLPLLLLLLRFSCAGLIYVADLTKSACLSAQLASATLHLIGSSCLCCCHCCGCCHMVFCRRHLWLSSLSLPARLQHCFFRHID